MLLPLQCKMQGTILDQEALYKSVMAEQVLNSWPRWMQDLGAVNFPSEQYDVEGIKASSSTFDELVSSLRQQARRTNAGGW